jgi:uncharacterized membrane protein (UPF0127 family)
MIVNRTRNTPLATEAEVADSARKKARGLMFRDSLPENHGLLMVFPNEGNHRIWMLGMRFPLDLIFLDSDRRVIGLYESVKPMGLDPRTWRTYGPSSPASYVIELNAGMIKGTGTTMGDLLEF